ncbi:MAG: M1 family metallopeptidase [Anaerolineae bacterium]|nr:M1 family metallopeptidase [Anaerolineae bacterium]
MTTFSTDKVFAFLVIALMAVSTAACRSTPPPTPTAEVPATVNESQPLTPEVVTPPTRATEIAVEATLDPVNAESAWPGVDWDDRTIFRPGLIESEQPVLDRLPGASVYHLDLKIADNLLQVTGHQEVHYTNRETEPLDDVYFRLFANNAGGKITVSEVKMNGGAAEPAYEFEDTALRVPLLTPLSPGQSANIQMDFVVEVPQEMAGNYGLFGYFDDVLVLDEFYPTIPVYDDEGWNVETPPPNADLSYNDASFYLARVMAPAGLTVAATGIEIDREVDGDRQVITFAAGPARDFYLAASNNYTVIRDTVGETTINSYAFARQTDHAELALQVALDALRSFNESFGPYPYAEFDVLSTPMLALGIEYPGLVGISLALYDPGAAIAGVPAPIMLEGTVAHEVAHQWFYNVVGNDQVDEPWLDEALAQYATWLYYTDTYGEAAARSYLQSWEDRWARVDRADIPIGLPAGDYEGKAYGAIVYGRGPLFLKTLAEAMGEASFAEFLRDYYETHKWGIGTAESFKQLAQQHCQCDLTDLFEEWVYAR